MEIENIPPQLINIKYDFNQFNKKIDLLKGNNNLY